MRVVFGLCLKDYLLLIYTQNSRLPAGAVSMKDRDLEEKFVRLIQIFWDNSCGNGAIKAFQEHTGQFRCYLTIEQTELIFVFCAGFNRFASMTERHFSRNNRNTFRLIGNNAQLCF